MEKTVDALIEQLKKINEENEKLKFHLSNVSKSFLFCLEKAMGYAYASATDGIGRKEAQDDFKKYRDEMLVKFQKNVY